MSKFSKVPLGKAALSIIDGDRGANYPKKTEFFSKGDCWFLNTSNVKSAGFDFGEMDFITAEKDAALSKGKLRRHDIVLTTRGTIGNCAYFGESIPFENIRINSGMVVLRADSTQLDPYFLYAFLRSEIFKIQTGTHSSGSAQPQLPIGTLRNIVIPLFELPHQRKIAAVLSALDTKIALNHRLNVELEGMAKLLYDYWFVQYDFPLSAAQAAALGQPHLTGQPYRSSGGPMVFAPQLKREIPKGWLVNELESFLTLAYGKALKKTDHQAGPYPVYGSGGIYGSHFEPLVKGPGIIVGRKGTVGSIHWEDDDFYPTDTTYYVIPSQGYSLVYLSHLLKSLDLPAMNTDSAVPGLNRNNAYSRTVANPPTKLIEEFTKIVSPLRSMTSANHQQNQELTTLRDWLLPMLMNGQVRVG